ncbi:hypothetical protein [Roseomonas sp. KE2513]|uniref:hypothetical protein n=1 Tax=Roseomonas sp. KE2513 TaxID=2479202 RepID=UPI0018DF2035|nr:hypothetical protein [Roseomonas sp. KE2513]
MPIDPVRNATAVSGSDKNPESFVKAAQELAEFARLHDLSTADALLTELLAVLFAPKK